MGCLIFLDLCVGNYFEDRYSVELVEIGLFAVPGPYSQYYLHWGLDCSIKQVDNNVAVVVEEEVDSTLDIGMADYTDHTDNPEEFDLPEENQAHSIQFLSGFSVLIDVIYPASHDASIISSIASSQVFFLNLYELSEQDHASFACIPVQLISIITSYCVCIQFFIFLILLRNLSFIVGY